MISSRDVILHGEDIYHGAVKKVITTPGTGNVVPRDAEVTLGLTMNLVRKHNAEHAGTCDLEWLHEHTRVAPLVRLLCDIMPIGLQRAVSTMAAGEEAQVWIHPLMAYGSSGLVFGDDNFSESIPPYSALVYYVSLISFRCNDLTIRLGLSSTRFGKLRFEEIQEIYDNLDRAQDVLIKGNKRAAQRIWCRTIRMLEMMRIDAAKEPQQHATREKVMLDTLKKAAENAIQLGWFKLAVTFSKNVLELESDNALAHYILGRAYFALGCNSHAKRHVRRAHLHDIENNTYVEKLREIERHVTLLDDSDSEDTMEDYEELAQIIKDRTKKNSKRVLKEVSKHLQDHIDAGKRTIFIEGGFDDTILEDIYTRLIERNRGVNAVTVRERPNGLEIDIP
ncbi:hypothetical protein BIW11_11682 [Tropilaelaps mercedesae]|uniref:peptidylprolyl isomerase n=1 Tax=Tropilaelaps mercedesae TaxID=418985 RepID=A0A1V9XAK4_9ACAR|nr:hypothetical protein BIW11_11682 [Tropilaelaps mercedesae]